MAVKVALKQLVRDHPFENVTLPERMVWTSSSLRLFRKCKRKFFWKYIMRLRPRVKAGSLIVGTAFHEALGEWYRGRGSSMAAIAARHAKAAEDMAKSGVDFYDAEEYEKLSATIQTMVGMLTGYAEMYGNDRRLWQLDRDHVEVKFSVNCGDFDFQGKVDVLTSPRKKGGKPFIVEHKTASKISSSFMERLPLDTQVRAYIFGGTDIQLNRGQSPPAEVLYDVVRKCGLKRKADEPIADFNNRISLDYQARPDFYFMRESLRFEKADILAFEHEMHATHREFLAILAGEYGDPRDPRSWGPNDSTCNEYFRTCENFQLCSVGLDRGTAIAFEQDEDMHEELSEEV